MKEAKIDFYAWRITYVWNRTILNFGDGRPKMVGYFEGGDDKLRKQNKWNFVPLGQENNAKEKVIVDGNELSGIQIIEIPFIKARLGIR